ncbi:MAG: Benzoyl-CoA reductase subunit C [Planctomycetes bacterium]|nr:Benzoyl-CoA reductase subunit C [Planctomycetota bacterium]
MTTQRTTAEITAACEEMYYDLSFAAPRRWKDASPDRKVAGYLPVFCPREVVHAAGMLPLGISGAGDWLEVIRGDAYYQSYLCHIPRSTVELALSGRLDFVDAMLFPSTCDVIRNLSGMWQMLKPGCVVRYVDVPQNYDPEIGGRFWQGELRGVAEALSPLSGIEVTDERLAASIRAYDENRAAIDAMYALRRDRPERAPTSEVYLVLRAANVLPVGEHTALVREYVAAAEATPRKSIDASRVVVVGAFCEQPPLGLIKTIERSGCFVVDDDFLLVNRWYTAPVAGASGGRGAFADLASAFVRSTTPTATMYSPKSGRGRPLIDRVRAARAEGVIFAAPSFCTPALLDQPMLSDALDAAGIPWTAFKYAENTGQFQPIREQTGTFADTMKLWEAA